MPSVDPPTYRAPRWQRGGHLQTIVPNAFRYVPLVTRSAERLELDDGDFLDLGWTGHHRSRLAILSHGLENRHACNYMQGMARALANRGWDVLGWTMRGCGPQRNRLLQCYHGGETGDLDAVVRHAIARHPAREIALVGFSLGGNLTLKYLGETGRHPRIAAAAAISVPCDLAGSAHRLADPDNRLYMLRFLRKIRRRMREKAAQFPGEIDLAGLDDIRDFATFDDRYTAPLHGFRSAAEYWEKSSCKPFLEVIRIPTLVLNAKNDPFLTDTCHPFAEAAASDYVHLDCPPEGGHVGFSMAHTLRETWADQRVAVFLDQARPAAC